MGVVASPAMLCVFERRTTARSDKRPCVHNPGRPAVSTPRRGNRSPRSVSLQTVPMSGASSGTNMGAFLLGVGTIAGTFGAGSLFTRQSACGRRITRAAPFWGQLAVAPTRRKQAACRRVRPEYVGELPLHSSASATSAPNRPPFHAHDTPPLRSRAR